MPKKRDYLRTTIGFAAYLRTPIGRLESRVSQLTTQFPVNCEFTNVDFCVNEQQTGQPMITGRRKGDLYVLPNSLELYFSHRFKSNSAEIWHQHLGHP